MKYINNLNVKQRLIFLWFVMKQKKTVSAIANGTFIIALLVGASAAQATTVIFDASGTNATGIMDLAVSTPGSGFQLYNVNFVENSANNLYGTLPFANFDFNSEDESELAAKAMNDALNNSTASTVGPEGKNSSLYNIGWWTGTVGALDLVAVWRSQLSEGNWLSPMLQNNLLIYTDDAIYADFTVVPTPVPAAVWLFGSCLLGLVGIAGRKKTA